MAASNWVDERLDAVLYRPAVVRATRRLPRWWRCDLARSAQWLDDRIGAEVLSGVNFSLCQACRRRMTWTEIGGDGLPGPFAVCDWCWPHLPDEPMDEVLDWDAALAAAGRSSTRWRWTRE